MPLLAVSLDDVISKSTVSAWDVALAVATLVIAWIAGRYAGRGVMRLASRLDGVNDDLRQLAGRVAKYSCWLLGAGIALTFLGAEIQPLLAAALIVAVGRGPRDSWRHRQLRSRGRHPGSPTAGPHRRRDRGARPDRHRPGDEQPPRS